MESKKTSKADLNEKRGTFFVLGIILALSLLFVSLEYTSKEFDSFLEDEYLDDLAQDFELLPSMDEEEELETASPQERTTVLTENIKVTEEVPSEIDNTSIPTPLIEQEVTEDMTNEKETDEQTPPNVAEQAEEPIQFRIVEQYPEFPGGMTEYMKWLTRNLRYPDIARSQKIQGKVVVQFIVNQDGTIADAKVVKSVNPHLDREAMRVIRMMPSWKPGIQDNKPCKTMVAVPIVFKL
ncbi:MAG: energy transducer TonB [Prevotella sp.]|jgi:protein TonB|nr:energy transducer TonB [Prevotella sp.]MBQ2334398.1 energy transducer TonB [Prevotella sp.]MBQ2345173.1 energy transducer TonB [Prevotella sp.]MBR6936942.1 energy transducer TonB [Prevotella sp.]